MIKRLAIFDFDGTLFQTFEPQEGKPLWEKYYEKSYQYLGWWGRPESLDLDVFDIKPYKSVLNQLNKELKTPNTYVVILTSRMEKLRSHVQAVLDANDIKVDKLDMKRAEGNKGIKLMRYVKKFPDLKVINVYDDRDTDIKAYEEIRNEMPKGIEFNIYTADEGTLALTESSRNCDLLSIIQDEIKNFI